MRLLLRILRLIIDFVLKGGKKKIKDKEVTGNAGDFPGGTDRQRKEGKK